MSDSDSPRVLRETAVQVAREAGLLLRKHFFETRDISYKGGIDLVTDADTMSEQVVLERIRARHPGHAILSEEAGVANTNSLGSTLRWIVDPLDGTTNYAHQIPHFCVSIGVEGADGGVLAGAVYDPMRDEMFSAAKGEGATLNDAPIHPSAAKELKRSILCTGFPYNIHEHPDGPVGRFIRRAQGIRRMGSAALDLAYIAAGRLDGYFEFGLKPWDVCAGGCLIQEAGASIQALDGRRWIPSIGDVVAAAPGIAEELNRDCAQFMSEIPKSV